MRKTFTCFRLQRKLFTINQSKNNRATCEKNGAKFNQKIDEKINQKIGSKSDHFFDHFLIIFLIQKID